MHSSSSQQRTQQSGSRGTITWLVLIIFTLYIVHSSNLFLPNDTDECPNQLGNVVHSETHLEFKNTNTSSSIANSEEKKTEEEEEEAEEEKVVVKEVEASMVVPLPKASPEIGETQLKHVVFGIAASSNLWNTRKEYIKTWWKPRKTRGVVWVDRRVRTRRNEGLPEIRISADTSRFKYRNRQVRQCRNSFNETN